MNREYQRGLDRTVPVQNLEGEPRRGLDRRELDLGDNGGRGAPELAQSGQDVGAGHTQPTLVSPPY